jgi:hypothetical protein
MVLRRRLVKGPNWPSEPIRAQVTLGRATWTVEVVLTARQRYVGLRGRRELAPGTGMLFVYARARPREHNMRGCLVPLDLAFLSSARRVVALHTMEIESEGTSPGSEDRDEGPACRSYGSGAPARYAVEVPAGELARAGVEVGMTATFSEDVPSPALADPWP